MGFVVRLEDLGVADIFQVLSLGKRTGKLNLTRRREQGPAPGAPEAQPGVTARAG